MVCRGSVEHAQRVRGDGGRRGKGVVTTEGQPVHRPPWVASVPAGRTHVSSECGFQASHSVELSVRMV